MTLKTLTDNVHKLSQIDVLLGEVLRDHEQDIMEYQRMQLLEGKDSDNRDIHPFYSEDLKPQGYFYTKESAGRYAAWKEGISYPFSVQRNADAPNLYINGRFHSELGVKFNEKDMIITAVTAYASKIVAKYGLNTFGLSMQKWNEVFRERGIKEDIIKKVKNTIYGN